MARFMSLKWKIITMYFVLITVPMLSVGFIWINTTAETVRDNVSTFCFETIKSVTQSYDQKIKVGNEIAASIAYDKYNIIDKLKMVENHSKEKRFDDIKAIEAFVTSIGFKYYYIDQVSIINKDLLITTSTQISFDPTKIIEQDWYKKMMNGELDGIILSDHKYFYQDSSITLKRFEDKTETVSIVRAIRDDINNKFMGIVIVDIAHKVIDSAFTDIDLGEESNILITDANGAIVSEKNKNYTDSLSAINKCVLGLDNGKVLSTIGKKEVLVVCSTSDSSKWKTVGVIEFNNLTKASDKNKIYNILIIAINLLLGTVIAVILSSTITKPVKELRNLMKKVEYGDLDVKMEMVQKDEIGQLGYSFNTMLTKIKELINIVHEEEKMVRDAEFEALQAQITPHFLYNTLNCIKSMANMAKNENILNMTSSLIELVRSTTSKVENLITVEEELKIVNSFVKIYEYKTNCENKFTVVYNVDKELYRHMIVKMSLQSIVENSLIHGLNYEGDKGLIVVFIKKEDEDLIVQVSDNGIGMSREKIRQIFEDNGKSNRKKFNGIGLKNINKRIKMYFGEKYGMEINSVIGNGTTVNMKIPVIIKTVEDEENA